MDMGSKFRAMHVKGEPLILANAWDAGSARILVAKGARAVASSSAADAFTLGRPDGTLSREEAMERAMVLVRAVKVPVSGDLEDGYGESAEEVALTIREAARIGLAGCCIEDTSDASGDAFGFDLAVERIRAGAQARDELGADFVLCARADGIMNGQYDCDEAIRRLQAFEAVGADVLYAPLPASWEDLARIVEAVKAPVNALAAGQFATRSLEDFAGIGVARISFGAALARMTHRAIMDTAAHIFEDGQFSDFTQGANGAQVDRLVLEGGF